MSGRAVYSSTSIAAGLHEISAVYNDSSPGKQVTSSPLAGVVQSSGKIVQGYNINGVVEGNYGACPITNPPVQFSWNYGKNYNFNLPGFTAPSAGNSGAAEYADQHAIYDCAAGQLGEKGKLLDFPVNGVSEGIVSVWISGYAYDAKQVGRRSSGQPACLDRPAVC